MSKMYGENGKWTCTICECSFTPMTIHELDDKDKLMWSQPQSFYRDIDMWQQPKCPHCHGDMEFRYNHKKKK
jgi:hypothetical protein